MHGRWDSEAAAAAPEYVTTSIGRVEIGNIANRLRDMAALLAAHGLDEAATCLARACGALLAHGAQTAGHDGCSPRGSEDSGYGSHGPASRPAP